MKFELAHIGLNCGNQEEASEIAGRFSDIFGFQTKVGNSSVFSGSVLEAMKTPYLGKHGHIAIGTENVSAAMNELREKGIAFNMDTAKYKDGRLTAVYLSEEIGGFAVHLVEKR